jgi:hypothetical protein
MSLSTWLCEAAVSGAECIGNMKQVTGLGEAGEENLEQMIQLI